MSIAHSSRESPRALRYATGRLFVQGASTEALQDLQERSRLHEVNYLDRRAREEGGHSEVLNPGCWGFYDQTFQIDALLGWLDPRGVRESKLRTALEARGQTIATRR